MAEIQISYINIYIYVTSDDGNLFYEQRASTRDRIDFNIQTFFKIHFDQDSRYLRYFISFEFTSCSSSIFLIPPLSLRRKNGNVLFIVHRQIYRGSCDATYGCSLPTKYA